VKNGLRLVTLSLALIWVLVFLGCSSQETPQAEPQRAHTEMEHTGSQSQETEAQMKDPVCGMTVSASSEHMASHDGRTYHFCSSGCQGKFVEDPQKYLSQ